MLLEQRLEAISKLVEERRSVTTQQLMELLHASESTVRRDLTALHRSGRLLKVHGGALAMDAAFIAQDDDIEARQLLHPAEKDRIARYAAALIRASDFVFLDSGTTTERMLPYLTEKTAGYVTNSITIARKLARSGITSYLIGGELKASTEAVVGNDAVLHLAKYNFTKGFFGTNGISAATGFTTPDPNEALVKKTAFDRCRERYILADSSKFSQVSPVTFAPFDGATIITTGLIDPAYTACPSLVQVTGG